MKIFGRHENKVTKGELVAALTAVSEEYAARSTSATYLVEEKLFPRVKACEGKHQDYKDAILVDAIIIGEFPADDSRPILSILRKEALRRRLTQGLLNGSAGMSITFSSACVAAEYFSAIREKLPPIISSNALVLSACALGSIASSLLLVAQGMRVYKNGAPSRNNEERIGRWIPIAAKRRSEGDLLTTK